MWKLTVTDLNTEGSSPPGAADPLVLDPFPFVCFYLASSCYFIALSLLAAADDDCSASAVLELLIPCAVCGSMVWPSPPFRAYDLRYLLSMPVK